MVAPTEILLYGDIGTDWWTGDGINEAHVLDGLKQLDPVSPKHYARINSPGGNVDTGLAIMNILRAHKQQMKAINPSFQLETVVDGYAMSSASVIFMAGDVRTIALGGVVMIHDAWGGLYGNAAEMRAAADRLELLSSNCANIYATLCTPLDKDSKEPARNADYFRTLMKDETYFIGDQAVNCGLATQQDLNSSAVMLADLSPEKLKGHYVDMMTGNYKKRTYLRPRDSNSLVNAKQGAEQLKMLLARMA